MTLHSWTLWRGMASSLTVSWTFYQQRCCYRLHLNPSNAVLSASCRSRQLPSWAVGSLQAWLHISTHLCIRSTFWRNFATFSGISLATGGAWHVSVCGIAEQWNYVISSCKISWSRLGWAEALGFSFFFPPSFVEWKLGFWNSSATTKEKHTAAGWVVSWPGCTVVADFVRASKPAVPCLTHTLPIFPAPEPVTSKTSIVFFMRNWCLQWNRSPQLSFGGEIHIFCCRFLWQGTGREAGAVLVYLLLWFCFEVHTC